MRLRYSCRHSAVQYPSDPPSERPASPLPSPLARPAISALPRWRQVAITQSGTSLLSTLHQAAQGRYRAFDTLLALDGGFALDDYRRLLQGFAAFVPGWEEILAPALSPGWHAWFTQQPRAPLLGRDLAALDAPLPAPVPGLQRIKLAGLPAALGSLYVLEVLGLPAQLVARQAREQHGLDAHTGAAFVTGWGDATAGRWREFRQRLEQDVQGSDATMQACVATHLTAETLARALRIAQRQGA